MKDGGVKVVIKLMRNLDQFERERRARARLAAGASSAATGGGGGGGGGDAHRYVVPARATSMDDGPLRARWAEDAARFECVSFFLSRVISARAVAFRMITRGCFVRGRSTRSRRLRLDALVSLTSSRMSEEPSRLPPGVRRAACPHLRSLRAVSRRDRRLRLDALTSSSSRHTRVVDFVSGERRAQPPPSWRAAPPVHT